MRNTVLFDDGWGFVKEAESAVDAAQKPAEAVKLPHTWNAVDGQDGGDDYYRDKCWYVKKSTKSDLLKAAGLSLYEWKAACPP